MKPDFEGDWQALSALPARYWLQDELDWLE